MSNQPYGGKEKMMGEAKEQMFGQTRVQALDCVGSRCACPTSRCVYCVDGVCDEPRINKGNGDATCHRWSNRRVLAMLEPLT